MILMLPVHCPDYFCHHDFEVQKLSMVSFEKKGQYADDTVTIKWLGFFKKKVFL